MFKKNRVNPLYVNDGLNRHRTNNKSANKNKMSKNYLNRNNLNKLPRLSTNSKLESIKQNNYHLFNCNSNFQKNYNKNQTNYYHRRTTMQRIFGIFKPNNKVNPTKDSINKSNNIANKTNNTTNKSKKEDIEKKLKCKDSLPPIILNNSNKKIQTDIGEIKLQEERRRYLSTGDNQLENDVFMSDEEDNNIQDNKEIIGNELIGNNLLAKDLILDLDFEKKIRETKTIKELNLLINKIEDVENKIQFVTKERQLLNNKRKDGINNKKAIDLQEELNKMKKNYNSVENYFKYPEINNKYEIEYIRLANLCDYYKYQEPKPNAYRFYNKQRELFYQTNRHHLSYYYMFNPKYRKYLKIG
jgi:hypothetical protein